jgi:chromosome segregation ATPase
MKNIVPVILLLLVVGLSVTVVRFAQKADKAGKNLEEERYSRMVAEETLQKNDAKLTTLQESLKENQNKMAKIEDVLDQEKNVNSDLKKQYDELTASKANLENKLQTALQEKAAAVAALQANQLPAPAKGAQPALQAAAKPVAQSAAAGH